MRSSLIPTNIGTSDMSRTPQSPVPLKETAVPGYDADHVSCVLVSFACVSVFLLFNEYNRIQQDRNIHAVKLKTNRSKKRDKVRVNMRLVIQEADLKRTPCIRMSRWSSWPSRGTHLNV